MKGANLVFSSLVMLTLVVAAGLAAATARLLSPLTADIGSAAQAVTRWCLVFLTGSLEIDELLVLGLLALLPAALILGFDTLVRQWQVTRRFLRRQASARLHRPPRRLARLCDRLGLANRVDVVRAAQPYSFCYGLLRPRICLSTGLVQLLSQTELEAVLRHERHHLQCYDPLKVLLARTFSRAFFFMPIVAELGRYYATAKELAADRSVLREQGEGRPLASALYKLLTVSAVGGPGTADSGAAVVAGLLSATDTRIDHILDPEAPVRLHLSLGGLVTSALAMLAITTVILSPNLVGAGAHVHALVDGTTRSCLL